MIGKVGEGSEFHYQTTGMVGNRYGMVKIDGPNLGNDRASWTKVKID